MTTAVLSGVALLPIFPLFLEMIAETTYPVNQAISTAIVMILPVGTVMIGAELGLSANPHESIINGTYPLQDVQICSAAGDVAHEVAKDYTSYVHFLMGCAIVAWVLFVFGFFPEMKRSRADQSLSNNPKE